MKLVNKILMACLLGNISFALQAKTQAIPGDWKTECVGYFQVSVPGEIDIGIARGGPDPSKLRHALNAGSYEFYEDSNYLGGRIRTSSLLPKTSFLNIKEQKENLMKDLKLRMKTDPSINILEYDNGNSINYFYKSGKHNIGAVFIYDLGRIYAYQKPMAESEPNEAQARSDYMYVLRNFRARSLYELPTERGVCVPYGFVKDDRPQKRSMGIIMRLKDHPDVKILFRDQSALFNENFKKEENASVEQELRAFWERPDWGGVKYQALGFRKFPSVQIGGYKGQSTFVEITRPTRSSKYECSWDDQYFSKAEKKAAGCLPQTLDYGYIAYVKGDPDAKEDTPNLLLYVMQNSEDAPDGKPTIGKDELKKMADTIAASIKRR
ncbi:T6SS immunity protein Tli4 family protein [Pseudomonas sp. Irchel 3E20]|uniref:T6SS immunity protein Tli4 family protein n=1 Tax=Pseudomonas sp. Irchel 3E20 TaxID=2008983 RepID=UPI00113FEBD6|nr:T6SS immunity protein Tli4 family protein [Pseudomonas sp. Irchel 3E20]